MTPPPPRVKLYGSDFRSRKADAFHDDAMVSGKDDVLRSLQTGREGLLYGADLHGEFLQPAQRTFGLGEVVDFVLQGRNNGFIGCCNVKNHDKYYLLKLISVCGKTPLTASGQPDTMNTTRSALAAMYWLMPPCKSAKRRWVRCSEVPPMPISLVTKM